MWFTGGSSRGAVVGRVAEHSHTLFLVGTSSDLRGITAGPDGNVWFVDFGLAQIDRITPAGTISRFPLPDPFSEPQDIVTGPDGNLWFTEYFTPDIGRITPSGTITEFPIPDPPSQAEFITAGPDGNLWFTDGYGWIGRVTTDGVITKFPSAAGDPGQITVGPDGNLWYPTSFPTSVVRMGTDGSFAAFPVPSPPGQTIVSITSYRGALWFGEFNGGSQLGVATTSGAIREFDYPDTPWFLSPGPNRELWITGDTNFSRALTILSS